MTRSVVLPRAEIQLRFSRSSGPGGQHAQKSETRVEAVFDVEASTALTDNQKRRVVARARVVLFVTKRSLCPLARSRRTASAPPAMGSPET